MKTTSVSPFLLLALLAASASSYGTPQRGRAPTPQRPPVVHAQREVVRTHNFVPQRSSPTPRQTPTPRTEPATPHVTPRLPVVRPAQGAPAGNKPWQIHLSPTPAVTAGRHFTKTTDGRQYDNGLHLRKGQKVTAGWEKHYFKRGYAHYPHYRDHFDGIISPFGFYYGSCVPWLDVSFCNVFPPAVSFIDQPIYDGQDYTGWAPNEGDNWFDHADLEQTNPGLSNAIDELNETFTSGNVDALVSLIDPNVSIAIYERGVYQYSMAANDYVDLTRDAIRNIATVSFTLDQLHQKTPNVFCVSGRHEYQDANGATQSNYVSFVLQDIGGQWTLTQVDNSPGVYESLSQ